MGHLYLFLPAALLLSAALNEDAIHVDCGCVLHMYVRYAEQARLTRSYVSEVCAIERPSSVASAVNWTCGVYARSPSIHVPMLPCNFIPVQPRLYTGTSRSTQPFVPPGSLNRVPASAGVRAGMSPLRQPGRQTHFCAVYSPKICKSVKRRAQDAHTTNFLPGTRKPLHAGPPGFSHAAHPIAIRHCGPGRSLMRALFRVRLYM